MPIYRFPQNRGFLGNISQIISLTKSRLIVYFPIFSCNQLHGWKIPHLHWVRWLLSMIIGFSQHFLGIFPFRPPFSQDFPWFPHGKPPTLPNGPAMDNSALALSWICPSSPFRKTAFLENPIGFSGWNQQVSWETPMFFMLTSPVELVSSWWFWKIWKSMERIHPIYEMENKSHVPPTR